jgi:hypothetical protein
MGNEYEVWAWKLEEESGSYEWHRAYGGKSLDEAMVVMRSEKAQGAGCVKLEWR